MKYYSNGHITFNEYFMMYLAKWKRAAVLLLFVWIVVTYFVISPLRCNGSQDEGTDVEERLKIVTAKLASLRHQHNSLISRVKQATGQNGIINIDSGSLFLDGGQGPTEEYENLRRRVYTNTKELWYYVQHELNKVVKETNDDKLQLVLEQIGDRKRSILSDQQKLIVLDGYHEWRNAEAANVSDLIQRRLKYLQNPPDCREARKVICNLNKGCGFGCQLHHIAYCLIFAYASERTLILNSKGWRYNNKGWEHVFHPISDSCVSAYDDKVVQWPVTYDAKVISLPFIDSMSQKPRFLPLAIPKDLAHRILRFNGDPASWWIGQILKYILKPKAAMQRAINETIAKMEFKAPVVGVHIRRTDKVGTEAAFHHIKEYMAHVKDYYDQLEINDGLVSARRVYLATDDANVLEDARTKYPGYTFLGDPSIAKTAATHRRYTPLSLTGLLVDLHMLSMCDYLVCTFSSQVGRVAYEMMQGNRVDASESFFSLDDIYYYGGQNAHDRVAVLDNVGTDDVVGFAKGDLIGIAGNHWNGYGRGNNKKTNVNGLIPWYKTADHLVLYPFPEYKEVPIYQQKQKDL